LRTASYSETAWFQLLRDSVVAAAPDRSQQGAQKANEADKELPDKVDTDTNAELLQQYGLDPSEVANLLGGNPAVG
jgi:hypothetical protein